MAGLMEWITDLGNSKMVALILFMTTFVGILLYVFVNPTRSRKFESYRYIPLNDDDSQLDPHANRPSEPESDASKPARQTSERRVEQERKS